jgi:AmmeMemoRadiSam system protein A
MASPEGTTLTSHERDALRRRALAGVLAAVRGERLEPAAGDTEALVEKRDAFVTVTVNGRLRGCLGTLGKHEPLLDAVGRLGYEAATADPRFPPLRREELDGLEVEVSVLGDFHPVRSLAEVVPGRHGVLVSLGGARGLLLPQVAERTGWDAATFVTRAMEKAGIPPERIGEVSLEVFEADHF